jgi:hypothetical protein
LTTARTFGRFLFTLALALAAFRTFRQVMRVGFDSFTPQSDAFFSSIAFIVVNARL